MTGRRDFLRSVTTAGALALLQGSALNGQQKPSKLHVNGGAIDVHQHHSPTMMDEKGTVAKLPMPPSIKGPRPDGGGLWTPEKHLEQMDKFGIAVAILSMTQNGPLLYNGKELGRRNVRNGNEYGAKLMQQWPKRFGLMGGLPLPDIDGVLKEIEYCYDTLKVDSIGIYTNDNNGRWPGDKYFEPMWQELNRRNAIVFVHPLAPTCCGNLQYGPLANMVEFDFDVTRAVASILVNGVMFRYPNIRFITVHSGGAVPMLVGRMQDRILPDSAKYFPNGFYAEVRKWYFDVAHATFKWPMAAAMSFMPKDHFLFGTDYYIEPYESTTDEIPGLNLDDAFYQALGRGNAEQLYPRFKGVTV